jgi:4-amino-4-deoxy-L-arabinose transferase-like glycosyltransferase
MPPLLLNRPDTQSLPQAKSISSGANDQFRTEWKLALLIIAAAAVYLRAFDPWYSTAYMDESIYVVYGRMFLAHHFEAPLLSPLQWSFGWYLWPALASIADQIGGLVALRELAAVLGTITVAATYGFASRVFSRAEGLAAAAFMAVLAPAVLVSRIATRDSGSVCFFALGLWAYAAAWQNNRKRNWLLASLCFFAAFLCKYLVAIYFPLLVLLALRKGRKAILLFGLPLFAASCIYGAVYHKDLLLLLRYGGSYNSLRATAAQAWQVYVWGRWDFWIIAAFAIAPLFFRQWRSRALWLWSGAVLVLAFQWKSRSDFDYWKHINYALLFLVPLAAAGAIALVRRFQKDQYSQMIWGLSGILAVAVGVGWLGSVQSIDRFIFWPNTGPVLAFFENRLTASDTLLVDDTVFRYYFQSTLHQYQLTDPMYVQRNDHAGMDAFKTSVAQGAFTYVIFDGGIGREAGEMDAAIRPLLGLYELKMSAIDPTLGHPIEIYARKGQPPVESTPAIRILNPASNALVRTNGNTVVLDGVATGGEPGWSAQLEVFTDRWYTSRESIPIAADGTFHGNITLGGNGWQQCSHLVRARLLDQAGHSRAVTMNYGITRANPDGSAPGCRQ